MGLKVKVENVNIRGCARKTNQQGNDYLLVRFEDETGAPNALVDKDLDRETFYKRDTNMDLIVDVDQGRNFTNLRIIDAKILSK